MQMMLASERRAGWESGRFPPVASVSPVKTAGSFSGGITENYGFHEPPDGMVGLYLGPQSMKSL